MLAEQQLPEEKMLRCVDVNDCEIATWSGNTGAWRIDGWLPGLRAPRGIRRDEIQTANPDIRLALAGYGVDGSVVVALTPTNLRVGTPLRRGIGRALARWAERTGRREGVGAS